MTPARDALLTRAMTYVADHGLTDLSLRQLAAGIGTSHRMLLYHFGTRDGLVAALVAAMEEQQRSLLEALAAEAASPRALAEAQWARLTDPAVRPFIALFFEVLALAAHHRPGTDGFLEHLTAPWLELAQRLVEQLAAGGRVGAEAEVGDDVGAGAAVKAGVRVGATVGAARLADDKAASTAIDLDELRLGVAVVRGLLVEVVATGDVAGPTASFHRFLDLLDLPADPA